MNQRLSYLLTSAVKVISGKDQFCPSCGNPDFTLVARKKIVTTLVRCSNCQLLYRRPVTSSQENEAFYQEEYTQGFTTDCPSDEILKELLKSKFKNTEKDYTPYIDLVVAAGGKNGDRLFDFGCSWGYGSWQFNQSGFDVESFEISKPRAAYAREKLGVKVYGNLEKIEGKFDIFFSSHVLEHVPSVQQTIEFGFSLLKPGGLFISLTPNGSEAFMHANVNLWNKLWGSVHPNFIDEKFYKKLFAGENHFLSSEPYSHTEIEKWKNGQLSSDFSPSLNGAELLILVRKR